MAVACRTSANTSTHARRGNDERPRSARCAEPGPARCNSRDPGSARRCNCAWSGGACCRSPHAGCGIARRSLVEGVVAASVGGVRRCARSRLVRGDLFSRAAASAPLRTRAIDMDATAVAGTRTLVTRVAAGRTCATRCACVARARCSIGYRRSGTSARPQDARCAGECVAAPGDARAMAAKRDSCNRAFVSRLDRRAIATGLAAGLARYFACRQCDRADLAARQSTQRYARGVRRTTVRSRLRSNNANVSSASVAIGTRHCRRAFAGLERWRGLRTGRRRATRGRRIGAASRRARARCLRRARWQERASAGTCAWDCIDGGRQRRGTAAARRRHPAATASG